MADRGAIVPIKTSHGQGGQFGVINQIALLPSPADVASQADPSREDRSVY